MSGWVVETRRGRWVARFVWRGPAMSRRRARRLAADMNRERS